MLRRPTLSACSFLRKSVLKQLFGLPCSFSSSATNQAATIEGEYKCRYRPSRLVNVEDVEGYETGGYHPLGIGDVLCDDRYQVLHKLGFNDFSTVWLARDRGPRVGYSPQGPLVALKVFTAKRSSRGLPRIPELIIPTMLGAIRSPDSPLPVRKNTQCLEGFFIEHGPNGSHYCLVSLPAGPSLQTVSAILDNSNRKLRSDLARKLAQQVTSVVECIHSSGIIYGDISASNLRFSPVDHIYTWSDSELYAKLGQPNSEDVETVDESAPGPSAPKYLVEAINSFPFINQSLLRENIMLTDFRRSFEARKPWVNLPPTELHYEPPEAHFDSAFDSASDVWMLACTLFEIRAGYPLFGSLGNNWKPVWTSIVEILGKPPDQWWRRFEDRRRWFGEDGEPRPKYAQETEGVFPRASRSSIRQKLREIGDSDEKRWWSDVASSLSEPKTSRMAKEEVELLGDLLEKMLRYKPGERITMNEVARHPWFSYES